jgi:tetratricopeptide (TPR) repeat protein
MAQRTRNHILEDKSRNAFTEIIPERWVVRDKSKDYGIDCEVEIFDDLGNPTGLIFYVQLKATESNSNSLIKKVVFEIKKIAQFQSYNVPVLIVRYSHLENKLYYTWANDITSQLRSEKNISVKFSENRILDRVNVENIYDYLIRYFKVLTGNYRIPIKTYITSNILSKGSTVTIQQYFKRIISKNPNYFSIVRNEKDSILQLKIGESKTYLCLSDTAFSSIGYEVENLKEDSIKYFNDILLACFTIILFNSNKTEQANEIFFSNDLIRILNLRDDFLFHFLPHLLSGDNCEKVLNETEGMFDITKDNSIQNISLSIIMLTKNLSPDRQVICQKFLQKQIEYSKSKNYDLGIGISNYNLGNFHKNIGNIKESLHHFLEARKYNPEYKKKGYYYSDIAGLLFELKKYSFSSKFYRKSIDLNSENVFAKALLGDTLLFLGNYELAVKYFDEFLSEHKDNNEINKEEWYLKYFCIHSLILNGYPKSQIRNIEESLNCLKTKKIEEAIEYDMLCSEAWLENGFAANKKQETVEAFVSFTMAALFNKENILSWVFATISGLIEEDDKYLHVLDIIKLAYYYHEENYIDILYDYTEKNLKTTQEPLFKMIELVISNIHKENFKFRIIDNNFEHETFVI